MGFSRQGLVEHLVNGPEEMATNLLKARGSSLGNLNEVVNEHISGAQGLVQRAVGRRCYLLRFFG